LSYEIGYTPRTYSQIGGLAANKRATIFDRVREQLAYQPTTETINRKPLRADPSQPTTKQFWELRLGDIRVFYFMAEAPQSLVRVISIGEKERNVVRIGGKLMNGGQIIAWLVAVADE
jgi:mRNA-degrading endonuclease RelE of RelBE toxin-antitoxin system